MLNRFSIDRSTILNYFYKKNIMSEDTIPYLNSDMNEDEQRLWDNTLMDGLHEFEKYETIQKIRNYYNGHHNIDGRPPSRKDFNEYLDILEKNL